MSFTGFLLIVVVVWLAVGVTAALVLGRRGHDPFQWGVLGAVLGPLVVPVAVQAARRPVVEATVVPSGLAGSGPIDVLVGFDGSSQSMAAGRAALTVLGPRVGRLCLAGVVPFDSDASTSGRERRADMQRALSNEGSQLTAQVGHAPDCVVLSGEPAFALQHHAQTQGFELIVVGSRGHGASRSLLGSVATRLAGTAGVPVLVAPAPQATT